MSFLDGGGLNGYGDYTGVVSATDGTYYDSDYRESVKLDAYTPSVSGGEQMEWWERLAQYGATRAIDAQFGPPAVNKTGNASTYAGQNGLTYSRANSAPVVNQGGSVLPLVLAAAVAVFALAG
ncbi:MAG: hypothetical protein U5M53_13755 [Rhodoferax sp.]|nr:hypothetical protein [Rhodoferax sp.]